MLLLEGQKFELTKLKILLRPTLRSSESQNKEMVEYVKPNPVIIPYMALCETIERTKVLTFSLLPFHSSEHVGCNIVTLIYIFRVIPCQATNQPDPKTKSNNMKKKN